MELNSQVKGQRREAYATLLCPFCVGRKVAAYEYSSKPSRKRRMSGRDIV
jgi:hypothetical protein